MTTDTSYPNLAPPPEQPKLMSIGILGLGAIGCLIASQLPASVKNFALLRQNNNTSKTFEFLLEKESSTTRISLPVWEASSSCLDVIIVCCKASQTLTALSQWQSAIDPKTHIVILQNGLGQHDQVHERFPNNTLFAATTTEGANRKNRQHICHAGKGITQWGYYAGPKQPLTLNLGQFEGEHIFTNNIKQALLDKLAINAVINPLTVKYDCTNGALLTNPIAFSEFKHLCDEIENCLEALSVSLSFPLFERAQQVADLTKNNISSMLQDIRNQQETEIDFINNYLIKKSAEINLPLPINRQLIDCIKQK
jgi:2-dehydropantoate 2-reductase